MRRFHLVEWDWGALSAILILEIGYKLGWFHPAASWLAIAVTMVMVALMYASLNWLFKQ